MLTDAQSVLLPDRHAMLAHRLAEARDDRHVSSIASALATLPLDPATPPTPEAYRARAEELTPDDALPELRTRIAILADTAQRHATKYWQHDRNQAGLAAIDWMVSNPGAPVVTMDRKIVAQLSPDQRARLQEIETTGRLDTDPGVYDKLDRLAVYHPKAFAATDLSQYRLALDGKDYARFAAFQKGDIAFAHYDRGRTVLDAGLIKAQFDPDGPEARAARGELDKTLRSFEAIEGRPPTTPDIDRVAGDIVSNATQPPTPPLNGDIVAVSGPYTEVDRRGWRAPYTAAFGDEAHRLEHPPRRGVWPLVEPTPDSSAFRKATEEAIGHIVHLPNGSSIPDKDSPTGKVTAPADNLSEVAAAGRQAANEAIALGLSPTSMAGAAPYLYASLGIHLGHAGIYDYQRTGNMVTGYNQLPHFRNVSNVNVGLFGHQAGFSLHQILTISGKFAGVLSSNAKPNDPYGLDPKTKEYIEAGYKIGESGAFGKAVNHPYAPW